VIAEFQPPHGFDLSEGDGMIANNQGVQQAAAWEFFGELRELVGLHLGLQEAEWRNRLLKLSDVNTFEVFQDADIRRRVFDTWFHRGLVQRRFAAELDQVQKIDPALKAVIGDKIYACSAFPLCNSPLCFQGSTFRNGHERSVGDRTIEIPGCDVRAFFRHRYAITEEVSKIHESQRSQAAHDDAVNSLLNDLLAHRKQGCIIESPCPDCRNTFHALKIEGVSNFAAEYPYRGAGDVHFCFDIAGLIGGEENASLSVVFELRNTHSMGQEKREYLEGIEIPWIEVHVKKVNAGKHVQTIGGKLLLSSSKLGIAHSGPRYCPTCAWRREQEEREKQRISSKRESVRKKRNELYDKQNELAKTKNRFLEIEAELLDLEITFNNATNQRTAIYLSNLSLEISWLEEKLRDIRTVLTELNLLESETRQDIESVNQRRLIDRNRCAKTGVVSEFEPVFHGTDTGATLHDLETLFNRCKEMRQAIIGNQATLNDFLSYTVDSAEDS
jgi:hypothetical protein